jgi:histidine triad (HIT) family protein
MKDCLFCSIANGDKSKLVWEDDKAAAFNDIKPDAPVHVLVVPKQHIESLDHLSDGNLTAALLRAVQIVAKQEGVDGAYRVRINVGRKGGQIVDHLHIHVMGGN